MKRFLTPLAMAAVMSMAGMVAVVVGANQTVEQNIEQAVRHNFAAAGLLSKLQVQAERMRRYEKEMFIYAAVPDKRAKYVKEFDDAYSKLLDLMNQAMGSQQKGFTAEDRKQVVKWSEATAFYGNEFRKTVGGAEGAATPEQRADLAVRLNNDIGPGKDRFREVLDGATKMRESKEKASLEINTEIDNQFGRLNAIVAGLGALFALGGVVAFARPRPAAPDGGASNFRRSTLITGQRAA
jgi:hypothetical protein